MSKYLNSVILLLLWIGLSVSSTQAVELIIGEETVKPGVVFIFEGAVKDTVEPSSLHLKESATDVHIEARVNWAEKSIPAGTPAGGFVPYLHITAKVVNQKTAMSTFVDLLPHINLVDNFHYARNIALPGNPSDLYAVTFTITPPPPQSLALHKDWLDKYGKAFMATHTFEYKDVNFKEIAAASRRK